MILFSNHFLCALASLVLVPAFAQVAASNITWDFSRVNRVGVPEGLNINRHTVHLVLVTRAPHAEALKRGSIGIENCGKELLERRVEKKDGLFEFAARTGPCCNWKEIFLLGHLTWDGPWQWSCWWTEQLPTKDRQRSSCRRVKFSLSLRFRALAKEWYITKYRL